MAPGDPDGGAYAAAFLAATQLVHQRLCAGDGPASDISAELLVHVAEIHMVGGELLMMREPLEQLLKAMADLVISLLSGPALAALGAESPDAERRAWMRDEVARWIAAERSRIAPRT